MKATVVVRSLLLIGASVLIVISFKYPMWYMFLDSNNFPKGLGMAIWATHPGDTPDVKELDGGLNEVNILNHYIGMRHISSAMPVFKVLPIVLASMAVLCLVAAFVRKRWLTLLSVIWFALVSAGGIVTLIYTVYSFGHDLDLMPPSRSLRLCRASMENTIWPSSPRTQTFIGERICSSERFSSSWWHGF